MGEDDDHQGDREPVDAVGQEPCGPALVGPLGADHLQHVLLPVAHRALRAPAEVARGPAQVLAGVGEQRLAGGERLPRGLRALGGGLGVLEDQRLEPGLDGDGDPLGLLRLAADGVDDPVAQPADAGLERLEQLTGPDELLPAREHLAAQQGAVGRRLADLPDRVVVGLDGVLAQPALGRRPARRRRPRRRGYAG